MKRLLTKIAENKLKFNESSMEYINDFRPARSFTQNDESKILDHWELQYEIEYKYSMLKSRPFSGLEERKENILRLLERKAKEIILPLAKTLFMMFHNWLKNHALTEPAQWAQGRFHDDNDDEYNIIDKYGFEESIQVILYELRRYDLYYQDYGPEKFILKVLEDYGVEYNLIDESSFEDYITFMAETARDILEVDDIDEFNERYDTDFEDKAEAEEWIDNTFATFDEDFISYYAHGVREEAIGDLLDEIIMSDIYNLEYIKDFVIQNEEDLILVAYEKIVFPLWFDYWSSRGIVETRKRVEDSAKELSKIKSMKIEDQFLTLNVAKNMSHQTGSMMEYYESYWGVDYVAMQRLSEMDTRNWDNELKEIGVNI